MHHVWHRYTLRDEPGFVIHRGAMRDYGAVLANATFCLDATGAGFSARIADYVATGCIPVIVADHVLWPLEGQIPYHDFSLRFRKRDIPRLPAELRAVTGTRLLELQHGLRRWHRAFIWDAEYGAAYATVLHALRRAANLTA